MLTFRKGIFIYISIRLFMFSFSASKKLKKQKMKGKTLNLNEFLADENGQAAGPGQSYVLANKPVNWADEVENEDEACKYMYMFLYKPIYVVYMYIIRSVYVCSLEIFKCRLRFSRR